jgi:DNA-binding NarL/FixJ family response regulator
VEPENRQTAERLSRSAQAPFPAASQTTLTPPTIKVLIADDHTVVRRGIKQIVAETPDIVVGGEAADAQRVQELVRAGDWDVLILDITMPGRSGLDVLRELKQERPRLPILILSMHSEDQFATRVLKGGAAGYIPKESAPEELVTAIRKVHAGGRYVSPSQAEKLVHSFESDPDKAPHETLSNREYEVLRLIASGLTVTQIAEQIQLSVKTISTYRTRILEKMRMSTNAQLTHYAIKNQLVD